MDIVLGIKNILKSTKSLQQLGTQDPLEWPTVKVILGRLKDDADKKEYQGAVLQAYSFTILDNCKGQASSDLMKLDERIHDRLEWSDVNLLRIAYWLF